MKTKKETYLLRLIKKTGAVREFKEKKVPNSTIEQIVQAGVWGLSVLGIQPWKIIPIRHRDVLDKICDVLLIKSDKMAQGVDMILRITSKIIKNSQVIIAVYNNSMLEKRARKFGDLYVERAHIAAIQAIGGAIQNMILQTSELGLGCVWLDAITFCSSEINNVLQEEDELVAFIAIGYSAIQPHRSRRQNNIVRRIG